MFDGSSTRVTAELLARMRDTMVHRGPDGADLWLAADSRAGLAHRRLSIIDLSPAAAQPMSNEDETLWVTFNGEIYNHAEIRAELERLGGHDWKTSHSDTEVILHAFEQWGIDCLARFRGMFAFALWDARAEKLWLCRDRLGIKPLYYSIHQGRISFASEIKALLADPAQPRAVDEEAFFDYLSFLTTPAPQTMFAGIRKLPAASWLSVDRQGHVTERRWWDVWNDTTPLPQASEPELAELILAELRSAVSVHKVSDVPMGVFLSGGIDSTTNAALFSEGESSAVRTFTIAYDDGYSSCANESPYARAAADACGAIYHERRLRQDDLCDFLPRMVHLQDEPLGDPVCVPVYYVSQLAREHGVIVCQVGEGADELFCGYPGWLRSLGISRAVSHPGGRWACRAGLAALAAAGQRGGWPWERLRRAAAGVPVFWSGAEAFTELQKRRLLSPRLRKRMAGRTSWDSIANIHRQFRQSAWDQSDLNWMIYADLHLRLPELLLMRVDKMSMGASLETRVPYLDHRFVAAAMSIPAQKKTLGGVAKRLLKRAVRGIIPDRIVDRRKQGFAAPVEEWFADRLGRQASFELERFCRESDLLDWPAVQRVLAAGRGPQAWFLLNAALWWRHVVQ